MKKGDNFKAIYQGGISLLIAVGIFSLVYMNVIGGIYLAEMYRNVLVAIAAFMLSLGLRKALIE